MDSTKTEESVAKFNEHGDDEWEIVENYHEMSSRLYTDGELDDYPSQEPCKHATNIVEEEQWRRNHKGKEHVCKFVRWVVPRVIKQHADDPYYVTTLCIDCLLQKLSEHYG